MPQPLLLVTVDPYCTTSVGPAVQDHAHNISGLADHSLGTEAQNGSKGNE
jgi:hypothetical protein